MNHDYFCSQGPKSGHKYKRGYWTWSIQVVRISAVLGRGLGCLTEPRDSGKIGSSSLFPSGVQVPFFKKANKTALFVLQSISVLGR